MMNRRQILKTGVLGGLGMLAGPMLNLGRCRLSAALTVSTRAVDAVLGSTVIDMLGLLTLDWTRLMSWQQRPAAFLEPDFRRLEASGVNIFHPAVETSATDPHAGALTWIQGWNRLLGSQVCFLARVDSGADLREIPRLGKIGVVVGFQNSNHFRTVADVATFHGLGQRVSQLTYNERNALGSGCYVRWDGGITDFGAEVVAEMNRLGMAIDISHCGDRTSRQAIETSRQPVLATHANCQALVPHQPRCISDDLIRRLARGGGVVGITAVRAFVGGSKPTTEDWLDHFHHVARLVGIEHVGIGSDVDLTARDPATGAAIPFYQIAGLDPKWRVYQLADGLLRRGYGQDDVRMVLGGNFRRALTEIWSAGTAAARRRREPRRDPFCPAPRRVGPRAAPG